MKTKEEIEDIIDETLEKLGYDCTGDKTADFVDGFVRGYTQCQEDMQKDVEYWQGEFEHWYRQAMDMSNIMNC